MIDALSWSPNTSGAAVKGKLCGVYEPAREHRAVQNSLAESTRSRDPALPLRVVRAYRQAVRFRGNEDINDDTCTGVYYRRRPSIEYVAVHANQLKLFDAVCGFMPTCVFAKILDDNACECAQLAAALVATTRTSMYSR